MKVISIISSSRKGGNTERIVKYIEEAFLQVATEKKLKVEFEQICLANLDIKFCRGCRICFDKGEDLCPLKDELLNIRDKISQADGIILASPVYVEDINGVMKNWIDRMAFHCHRPAFFNKTAVIVTTSSAGTSNHGLRTMKSALSAWGFHVSAQRNFKTGAFIEDNEINYRHGDQIRSIANKLFCTINGHRAEYPSFYSLVIFKVQQIYWGKTRKEQDTFDYFYWKDQGWSEKTCHYYVPHHANSIKVSLARIVGNIVSNFFA